MNSNSRILVAALAVLCSSACFSRVGSPKPPSFPSGGLLALSTPPPNPWSLANAFEGVYNTSSRFGSNVVVHASQWGSGENDISASLSILGYDHYGVANLQPGCLVDHSTTPPTTLLVFEGYWRYLDVDDPDPSSTGLVRLFTQPQEIVDYVCKGPAWGSFDPPGDPRPPPGVQATLSGATGSGENTPGNPLIVTWVKPRRSRLGMDGQPTFFVGAHHGGCQSAQNCGISENTPETAILAAQLGGDYLEVDTHLTADNIPVFFHVGLGPIDTQGVYCRGAVEDYTYDQLTANCRLRNGEIIPRMDVMLEYIYRHTNLPTYLDSKSDSIVVPTSQVLKTLGEKLVACNPPPPDAGSPWPPDGKECLFPGSSPVWQRGVIGLPDDGTATTYQQALDGGLLAPNQHCLVEDLASEVTSVPCVAWMPRYTRGPMTPELQMLQQSGVFVGFWTIDDPATMDAFLTIPSGAANGYLTNYLGLLNQRFEAVGVAPIYTPYLITTP